MKRDVLRRGAQKVDHVLRVKADLHLPAVVLRRNTLFALAGFRQRRMNLQLARQYLEPDSSRSLVRKLSHTFYCRPKLIPFHQELVWMILRKDAVVIREVPGQLTAQQQPLAQFEEQVILISREADLCVGPGFRRELQD